jgi:heme exporter protein CcmD
MIDVNADYIPYVAAAYGMTALVLLSLVAINVKQASSLKRQLKALKLSDPGQTETP